MLVSDVQGSYEGRMPFKSYSFWVQDDLRIGISVYSILEVNYLLLGNNDPNVLVEEENILDVLLNVLIDDFVAVQNAVFGRNE